MSSTTSLRRAASLLSVAATTALAVVALSSACARGGATGAASSSSGASVMLASRDVDAAVARGRQLVLSHACGDCHGGVVNPDSPVWLSGARTAQDEERVGPFVMRPSNLTPDSATGIGKFSLADFTKSVREGVTPAGNELSPPMSEFKHLTDKQVNALYTHLRSLPPKHHKVKGQKQ